MLNKTDLIRGIASESDLTVKQVEHVINRFLELIGTGLALGEDVKLSGFGKFESKILKSQTRRNPRTGEKFVAPDKTTVAFAPSLLLRDRVDRSHAS